MNHIINISLYVTKCFKQNTEKIPAHGKIHSLTYPHCKSIYILEQVIHVVIIEVTFSFNQTQLIISNISIYYQLTILYNFEGKIKMKRFLDS